MPTPGVTIRERDLSAYVPKSSPAEVLLIGPSSRGAVDTLTPITDEGAFVDAFGSPGNGLSAARAAIRYLRQGSNLKYIRVAGTGLKHAKREYLDVDGNLILTVNASSKGTWANNKVSVSIRHVAGSSTSYTLEVRFDGRKVETFTGLTNANVETSVNLNSSYVDVSVESDAGSTRPVEDYDSTRLLQLWRPLTGGNDGNFPTTDTADSQTGGVSGEDSIVEAITPTAGQRLVSFTLKTVPEPGSLTIVVEATDGSGTNDITFDDSTTSNAGKLAGTTSTIGTSNIDGYVNYSTGEVILDLGDDGSTTDNVTTSTDIDATYRQGTSEASATTGTSQLTYSGYLARPGIVPASLNILVPRYDQLDVGTSGLKEISVTLTGVAANDIDKGSFVATMVDVNGDTKTIRDNGENNLSGSTGVLTGDVPTTTENLVKLDFSGGVSPSPAFVVGEALTQASTGATGIVREVVSSDVYIVDEDTTTAFTVSANDVTGGGGGGGSVGGQVGARTLLNTINYTSGAAVLYFDTAVQVGELVTATYNEFITSDAAGALSGANLDGGASNTVNLTTGEYGLTFVLTDSGDYKPNFPDGGSLIFRYGHTTVLGVGDASETSFTGRLKEFPVKPGSVVLSTGASSVTDDGNGAFSSALGTGTVDYWTGEVSFTFNSAPSSGVEVEVNADPILMHIEAKRGGPDYNRQATLTDGFYVQWNQSTIDTTRWRIRVFFNNGTTTTAVEDFDLLESITHAVDVINGNGTNVGSSYITAEATGFVNIPTTTQQQLGLGGGYSASDVIGTTVSGTSTGLKLAENHETVAVNFVACPGQHNRSIVQALIDFAESPNRRAIAVLDTPDFVDYLDAVDWHNGEYNATAPGNPARPTASVPYPPLSAISSGRAFICAPYCQYYDAYAETEVWEPLTGEVLNRIAYVAAEFDTWNAVFGLQRGKLNVLDVRWSLTGEQRAQVYDLVNGTFQSLNVAAKFTGEGIYLWGHRMALRAASSLDRLNNRWTLDIIENRIQAGSRQFIAEIADDTLFRQIRRFVTSIMSPIKQARGINDFSVICDDSTNPPEQIAANTVKTTLFIQFNGTAEYLEFDVYATPLGLDFSDVRASI